MKDWKEVREEWMQDSAVRAEVERLEPKLQLARQLIGARLEQNLTQAELAHKAGVKQAYIARLESGEANPTFESLNKVANVLGLRVKLA